MIPAGDYRADAEHADLRMISGTFALAGAGARLSSHIQAETRLPAPNPAGRLRLVYDFHVPAGRTREQCRAAARVLLHWFTDIGGFQRVDPRLLKLALAALDAHAEQELHWAIAAKAASLQADGADQRRAKRVFAGTVGGFLRDKVEYWLEQSEAWRRAELRRRASVAPASRRCPADVNVAPASRRCGTGYQPVVCSTGYQPVDNASAASAGRDLAAAALDPPRLPRTLPGLLAASQRAARHALTWSRLWECLGERAKKRALARMIPAWDAACRAAGVNPHDARLDPLHLSERLRAAIQLTPRLLDALRPEERPTVDPDGRAP